MAFSLITGARITALSVDRRMLDNSLVDFVVGGENEDSEEEVQRLTLGEFRRRLVAALLADEPLGPVPQRETDIEALQLHVGVRYLLLAPLYGYSLRSLKVDGGKSVVSLLHDGVELSLDLDTLRLRLRAHTREELDRVSSGNRGVIDLSRVAEAEVATERKDFARVKMLLGAWPAPLAIFLRTPDGQMLAPEARSSIARGLALLGSACAHLGEGEMAEEVFRLAVQYAQDGSMAGEVFRRMGEALLNQGRPGESIAALRRAINLGAPGGTDLAPAGAGVPGAEALRGGADLREGGAEPRGDGGEPAGGAAGAGGGAGAGAGCISSEGGGKMSPSGGRPPR